MIHLISPFNPIRWILGIIITLFLPGYFFYGVIFPLKVHKVGLDRVIYSIVLSLAIISLMGMILNYIPHGIDIKYISLSLAIFISVCVIIPYVKEGDIKNNLFKYNFMKLNSINYQNILVYFFLIILLFSSTLLKSPLIINDLKGNNIGGDISLYVYLSEIVNQVKQIPRWSKYLPLEQPSRFADGIPILFSFVSQIVDISSIEFSFIYYVLIFEAVALSIYVMILSYQNNKWAALLGLFFWVFSVDYWKSNALIFSSVEKGWILGSSPPNVVCWLYLIVFLHSIFEFEKRGEFGYIVIMIILIESSMIYHQLSFIIQGVLFIIFLIFYYKQINLKSLFLVLLIPISFTLFFTPSWIKNILHEISTNSGIEKTILENWADQSSVKLIEIPCRLGIFATLFIIIGLLSKINLSKITERKLIILKEKKTLYLELCLLGLLISSYYGPYYISSLQGMRYFSYTSFFTLPLLINGIYKIINSFFKRYWIRILIIISLILIMIIAINEAITQTNLLYKSRLDDKYIFNEFERNAAFYLKDHISYHEVVVADFQKTKDTAWIRPFSIKQVLLLPEINGIIRTPPPYDEPVKTLEKILDFPDTTNIMNGIQKYNFTYYFLENKYNQPEIEIFNLLPYFTIFYENSEVTIFRVNISALNKGEILPVERFESASKGITIRSKKPGGFGFYLGSKKSSSESFDGNYTIYKVNIIKDGLYQLIVRRWVNQIQEYIDVYIDEQFVGNLFFTDKEWQTSSINIDCLKGVHSIKFVFKGTVESSDGLDYIIIKS